MEPNDPSFLGYLGRQGGNALDQAGRFFRLTGPADFSEREPSPMEYMIRQLERATGLNAPPQRLAPTRNAPSSYVDPYSIGSSSNPLLAAIGAF